MLVCLLAGAPCAAAQPGAAAQPADGLATGLAAYGIRGTLTYRNYSYFQAVPQDDRNFYNEGILQVEWARRLAPWVSLKLVGEVRGDTARFAEGVRFQIPDDDLHRSIVALKEGWADFRRGPFELSVGKQLYAWGTADVFNPTDNLNPRDYMDPIDSEKMGVWSVAARATLGATQITFVVVPVFTPSRLPLADSRWAPPPPSTPIPAMTAARDLPEVEWSNVQYGGRVRTTVTGWDLSASYFEGFETTPVIKVSQVPVAPGVVVPLATPVFTRMRVLGMDMSTTWRKFEFHVENAFKFVVRDGRHDRFQIVAGFGYTWDGFRLRWLDRISVVAEYAREVNLSTNRSSNVLAEEDLVRLGLALPNNAFSDGAAGRVTFRFTEDTELRLTGALDFTNTLGSFVRVHVAHRIFDALHAEAGLDFFTGERGKTFWGQWRDNDRFFFVLRYFF